MKYVVILYDYTGAMMEPEVTLYDDIHDPLPYIKSKLDDWDSYREKYQTDLKNCQTIEDVQVLIQEYSIYTMQIHVVDKINPRV